MTPGWGWGWPAPWTPPTREQRMQAAATAHRRLTHGLLVLIGSSFLILAAVMPGALGSSSGSGSSFCLYGLTIILAGVMLLAGPMLVVARFRMLRAQFADRGRLETAEVFLILTIGTFVWAVPAMVIWGTFDQVFVGPSPTSGIGSVSSTMVVLTVTAGAMALTASVGGSVMLALVHRSLLGRWPRSPLWWVAGLLGGATAAFVITPVGLGAVIPPWGPVAAVGAGLGSLLPLELYDQEVGASLRAEPKAPYLDAAAPAAETRPDGQSTGG